MEWNLYNTIAIHAAHTTKLLAGIEELLSQDANQETAASLALTIKLLEHKQTILEGLDAPLINDETELEEEIMESEDARTKILQGTTRLELKLNTCEQSESTHSHPVSASINSTASISTASDPPHTEPETTVSSTSVLHTVSSTISHTPHTSDDAHHTPPVASGLIYSEANITPVTDHDHTTVVSSSSYATSRLEYSHLAVILGLF